MSTEDRPKFNTAVGLMAVYGSTQMTLAQCAKELGISYNTARNQRAAGTWPIPMAGNPLMAHVDDVAAVLDKRRDSATCEPT